MSDPLLGRGESQRLPRHFSLVVTPSPRSLELSHGGSRLPELHEVYRGLHPNVDIPIVSHWLRKVTWLTQPEVIEGENLRKTGILESVSLVVTSRCHHINM